MKTAVFVVAAVLVASLAWAQAERSPGSSELPAAESEASGPVLVTYPLASHVGRRAAYQLWEEVAYPCTTYRHAVNDFYPDVQDQVVAGVCERLYGSTPDQQEHCAAGAKAVVRKKIESCTSIPSDCNEIGEDAAALVTVLYCLDYSPSSPLHIPTQCVPRSTARCQDEAVDLILDWFINGNCDLLPEVSEIDELRVAAHCAELVEQLAGLEL